MQHARFELIHPDAKPPHYATPGAAGADLYAVGFSHPSIAPPDPPAAVWTLWPGERVQAHTGLRVALPPGCEGQVRSRSGLAFLAGVVAFHGTLDSDYRGELRVLLFNTTRRPVELRAGERVGQLVVCPVARADWAEGSLPPAETQRGEGGFGSTGR